MVPSNAGFKSSPFFHLQNSSLTQSKSLKHSAEEDEFSKAHLSCFGLKFSSTEYFYVPPNSMPRMDMQRTVWRKAEIRSQSMSVTQAHPTNSRQDKVTNLPAIHYYFSSFSSPCSYVAKSSGRGHTRTKQSPQLNVMELRNLHWPKHPWTANTTVSTTACNNHSRVMAHISLD